MGDEEKRPVGRPIKYDESIPDRCYRLALLGLTDVEMADAIGIAESTFNKWKHDYSKFSESINKGKVEADAEVAKALRDRALGYKVVEDKIFDGEIVTLVKQFPPDTQAASLWLRNRQPSKWRDKQEVDHTTKGEKITLIERVIKKHEPEE
jgi:hypothetical protein